MPDDTITLISTTDTPEQVQQALTGKPESKPAETPPETPADYEAPGDTAAAAPAEETAEQRTERENKDAASEAGRVLASTKRKQKIQAEIDAETRRKYDVRRDVEMEEARLQELRRQRMELEAQQRPAETQPAARAADAPADGEHPEPKLDAVDDKGNARFATYEDYLSAHAVWTREEAMLATRALLEQEKFAERARIEHASASRVVHERLASYNQNLEAFKQTHADFDAAFDEAKEAVQDTLVAIGPQALKVVDGYTVFDAEDGPALTYYLLKRPEELKAIAMKPPQQQLVHLARLEERLRQGGAKKSPGPPPTARETKAPTPIKPVGSGPTATTVSSDEESYQDYRARRERELRARYGR